MSPLSGGIFDAARADDDTAELRTLVDELGRRSFEARLGQRGMPEEFDDDLWRTLEETGLARLTSTPDLGAGPVESAVVLYGVARHAGAVPIAETDLLAAWLAQQAGIELPSGPLTVAIADVDTADGRAHGIATDVPWLRACAATLLVARAGDEVWIGILDLDDAQVQNGHNLAGEPRDRLTVNVAADQLRPVEPAVADELIRRGAWARCVQIIGALDAAAALSVDHTRQRIQFGRTLSRFQAVRHSLASMAGDIERARAATTLAIAAATEYGFASAQTDFAVTVAKVTVGRVADAVTTIAHQLHGAIGVTAEHPLWLATMRAQSWATDYGSPAHYARRLGRLALAAPEPWDVLADWRVFVTRDQFDPATVAVVCVECQNGVLGREAVLPALTAETADLIGNLRRLLDAARATGVRVVHATYDGALGGTDTGTARLWRTLGPATAGWASGSPATQVISELLAPSDLVLTRHHGLFPTLDSELLPVLKGLGVHTVVLAGVSLNLALPHTAGHTTQAGFHLIVPRDAVAGTPAHYAEQVLDHTIALLGRITTVDDLIAEWAQRKSAATSVLPGSIG